MNPGRPPFAASFALISVLALVTLATLSATAFLATSRLDRLSVRPLSESTRLELVLQAGEATARALLENAVGPDFSRIVTYWRNAEADELGYLLVGAPSSISPSVVYFPLFSCAPMTNGGFDPVALPRLNLTITNTRQAAYRSQVSAGITRLTSGFNPANSTNLPLLGDVPGDPALRRTSPPVAWIVLRQDRRIPGTTNTTNVPYARFAFFVEDLQGLIDAERMGGYADNLTYRERDGWTNVAGLPQTSPVTPGTNPAEISLVNLRNTRLQGSATAAQDFSATAARLAYVSPFGVLTANRWTNANDVTSLRYLATGLRAWAGNPGSRQNPAERIPYAVETGPGLIYTNAGRLKFSLEGANLSAINLRNIIASNLPSFADRGGGLDRENYLLSLAAGMADYIDADSNVTADTNDPPRWRGVEAIPWPNEIFTQFYLDGAESGASSNGFVYAFKYRHFVEVWNIYQKEVPLAGMRLFNNRSFRVSIPPGGAFDLADPSYGPVGTQELAPVANSPATLKPGEFGMLATPLQTLVYTNEGATRIANVAFDDWNQNSSRIIWNGVVVSQTPDNQLTYNKDIRAANPFGPANGVIFATALGYAWQSGYRVAPPGLKSVGGDPRGQFFLQGPTKGALYPGYSSPGGRNFERLNNFSNAFVDPQNLWADGGRTQLGDLGENPSDYSRSPEEYYNDKRPVGWSTNLALARINDTGTLTNICELGNIYDPLQWEDSSPNALPPGARSTPPHPGLWTNLTGSALPARTAAGRASLRIGRPEYSRFAFADFGGGLQPNMGQSAVALMDLFSLPSRPLDLGGKINLNTAPAPVLAALAGGCWIRSDPQLTGVGGSGANFAVPAAIATNVFPGGVQKFRHRYPFHTPGQLAFISPDANWPGSWPAGAVFGNTNLITNSVSPGGSARINVTAWNDAAAEEWFARLYGLASVDSSNYRVYVAAQLLQEDRANPANTNGVPRGGVVRRYFQVYTPPTFANSPTSDGRVLNLLSNNVVTYESAY
jgi:hypothetical protein